MYKGFGLSDEYIANREFFDKPPVNWTFRKFVDNTTVFEYSNKPGHVFRHGNDGSGTLQFKNGCALFCSNDGKVGLVNDDSIAIGKFDPVNNKYPGIPCSTISTGGSASEVNFERSQSDSTWAKNMSAIQREWQQVLREQFYDNE